jgi:HEAT repeat protein
MQRDPLAGDLAATALASDPEREFAASLLRLLAEVGRRDHLPIVRTLAKGDDVMIRAQALHALGLLTDGSDVPVLVEAMADPSPWAAMHAARGVREAGGRALLEDMVGSDHVHARLAGQVLNEEAEA